MNFQARRRFREMNFSGRLIFKLSRYFTLSLTMGQTDVNNYENFFQHLEYVLSSIDSMVICQLRTIKRNMDNILIDNRRVFVPWFKETIASFDVDLNIIDGADNSISTFLLRFYNVPETIRSLQELNNFINNLPTTPENETINSKITEFSQIIQEKIQTITELITYIINQCHPNPPTQWNPTRDQLLFN